MSGTKPNELIGRANRAWQRGKDELAQELLSQAREEASDNAALQTVIGGFAELWKGNAAEAQRRFDEVLSVCPDDEGAQVGRMLALRALAGDDEERPACRTHICGSARAYRQLADQLCRPDDVVVEVGPSTGKATRRLASRARHVIAVEKSRRMVALAREALRGADNVTLLQADAWQLAPILKETARADCIFVDISGSAPPWTTLRLAEKYRRRLRPRCLVIRNTALARFVASVVSCEGRGGDEGDDDGQ